MTEPSDVQRSRDTISFDVPLPHLTELPVLGVPVRFESNSADALALVEAAFGSWRGLGTSPELIGAPGARFRLIVQEGSEGAAAHAPVRLRIPDPDHVVLHTPGSLGIVDGVRREATAYVTTALLADRAHARLELIEGMTLTLVSARNRYPVHAAAIARGPAAILLAGPPGAGKSTLAYQAYRRGLRVLTDDAAYVQVEPLLRLWGIPGRVSLLSSARAHFPELARLAPTPLGDGSEKVAVSLPNEWPGPAGAAPVAIRAGVCLLERAGGRARLTPAAAPEVRAFLKDGLGISRLRFGDALDRALERLVPAGGWRLALSSDPAEAAPLLEEVLADVEERA
jgi:hypothetical protein